MDQIELVLYSRPSAIIECGPAGIKDERYDSEHGTLRERRRHLRIAAQYLDRAWLR